MISRSLRFEGFDAASWRNLVSCFAPRRRPTAQGASAPRGDLVLIIDSHMQVRGGFHTQRGPVAVSHFPGRQALPELCAEHRARRAVIVHEGTVEAICEEATQRVPLDADYATQWLTLAAVIREHAQRGKLIVWPEPWAGARLPAPGVARRALDLVLPDEHALVLAVWNGNDIWTAVSLRRREGEIDWVAGPDLLREWTGPLGGDWQRDYRVITREVSRAAAPVHLGIFTEAHTLQALLRDPNPGAWSRAVAVRDVIVHPTPPYVGVAVGADALRAAAVRSARWIGGLSLAELVDPVAHYFRERVMHIASVRATLGFDPLKMLALRLRRSEQEPPTADADEASADMDETA